MEIDKKYFGYKVNEKFIEDNKIVWKETGNGLFIIGSKNGHDYFIKKNANLTKPTRDSFDSDTVFKLNYEKAKRLERKQNKLSELMSDYSFDSDYIAIEEDHFWDDDDNKFVTITRYLSGAIDDPEDHIFNKSIDVKHDVFLKMATLLQKLHKKGIIHGDLKESNFLFKKNKDKYDIYIIDFDNSYTNEFLPILNEGVPYTEGYESPEILSFLHSENPELDWYLTPETDVFTLALIIHNLFTHKFLEEDKDSMAVALLADKDYKIPFDKSLDQIIGGNCNVNYESLLNWMMVTDFEKRATIEQVIKVLNDELEVPEEYFIGTVVKNYTGVWSRDENVVNYDEEKLKKNNIIQFKKSYINHDGYRYEIKKKDGLKEILTIEEVIKKGYLDAKEVELDEPWLEDKIEFSPTSVLKENNIAKIKRNAYMGKHRYEIVLTDGMTLANKSALSLISEGLAKSVVTEYVSKYGEPWPEDSDYKFASDEECNKNEVESIEKVAIGGTHQYSVKFKGYEPQLIKAKQMILNGLLVKK